MCRRCFPLLIFLLLLSSWSQAQGQYKPTSDTLLIIGQIKVTGNKITKSNIIFRELEFKQGDTLFLPDFLRKLKRSKENLLNRSLFNFVEIIPQRHDFNKVNILIRLIERWYIWPVPILSYSDRNFNVWWKNHDYSRTNFGIDLYDNNFRGRMERLDFIFQGGYDKSMQLIWTTPYINKNLTWGIGLEGGFIFNHEIDYSLKNNELVYYSDRHNYSKKYYFAQFEAFYRPKFVQKHSFYIEYNQYRFTDSLLLLNPNFAYQQNKFSYFLLEYNFKLDYRDYAPYPLQGHYFEFDAKKEGLGLLSKKVNLFSLYVIYDQYIHLQNRWYFAYNVSAKVVTNKYQPYFLQQGIGYLPMTLRGYQLHIINGQAFGMFRSNLKFELIPKTKAQFQFIRTEKFSKFFYALYANLFLDTGYVMNNLTYNSQTLENKLLIGSGVGLDYVTYYDVVFRIEYTINRQREKAFFISFVAPI